MNLKYWLAAPAVAVAVASWGPDLFAMGGGGPTVYLGQPPEVNWLCTQAAGPPKNGGTYRACYLPPKDGRPAFIVAAKGDTEGLLHELRHFFEGRWHD